MIDITLKLSGGQASSNLIIKYVDIPKKYKDIFIGPLYTFRLNIWHQEAARLVGEICRENSIDIIHRPKMAGQLKKIQ